MTESLHNVLTENNVITIVFQPSSENMDQLHGIAACQTDDVRQRNWLSKSYGTSSYKLCRR